MVHRTPDFLLQRTGCEKFTYTFFVVTQDRLKNVLVIAAYDRRGPRD
jgi:hypothetical protein